MEKDRSRRARCRARLCRRCQGGDAGAFVLKDHRKGNSKVVLEAVEVKTAMAERWGKTECAC